MTALFRSFIAVCAAFVATVICIVERHFYVTISRPSTWVNPFQHKCGLLAVMCLTWMTLELIGLGLKVEAR
ncbi:hypothetical protein SAMN05421770_10388 [Granulicella rosea]|uniref:Uncharacterized protein n=1 Tax=Granulicella rosea TaxID=474952 RepID=A0A239IFK0_9BACT|nr:hypothetical protein [Granulicella rosea]SNS92331.1 hypothetical protein SAMN05421770_10388 [Granulicella rosea]